MRLITALVTPFKKHSNSEEIKIDFEAVELLLKEQFNAGVREVVIMGSTGEGHSLTKNERIELVEFVISVKNKLNASLIEKNSSLVYDCQRPDNINGIDYDSPRCSSVNGDAEFYSSCGMKINGGRANEKMHLDKNVSMACCRCGRSDMYSYRCEVKNANFQNINLQDSNFYNENFQNINYHKIVSDTNFHNIVNDEEDKSDYNENHQKKNNLSSTLLKPSNAPCYASSTSCELMSINNSNQMRIIASINSNITQFALDQINDIKKYDMNGLDGLMSACPYYNKPTQEGIFQHFSAIASSVNMPIMLYDIPGRTGVSIANDTLQRLANNFGNIESIKLSTNELSRMNDLFYFLNENLNEDYSGGYDRGGDGYVYVCQSCWNLNTSDANVHVLKNDPKIHGENTGNIDYGESMDHDVKNIQYIENAHGIESRYNLEGADNAESSSIAGNMQIGNGECPGNNWNSEIARSKVSQNTQIIQSVLITQNAGSNHSNRHFNNRNCNNKYFNNGISILCGDDESVLSFGVNGAAGVVSVISNAFPHEMVYLCYLIQKKDFVNALNLFKKLQVEMKKISFTTNPIGIKKAVSDKYDFMSNICRLPLVAFE